MIFPELGVAPTVHVNISKFFNQVKHFAHLSVALWQNVCNCGEIAYDNNCSALLQGAVICEEIAKIPRVWSSSTGPTKNGYEWWVFAAPTPPCVRLSDGL